MKTRTKLSIGIPIFLLAVLLSANFSTIFAQTSNASNTMTPIKHVVVIFQENVSFDHYFATYPNASNPPNEPQFTAKPGTPTVNGLTGALLTSNPNELVTGNASDNPARLDRTEPVTCDNDHGYSAEQAAFNGGLMNMFPEQTSCSDGIVMDYYDGNTATAVWNYAQDYTLNDNAFGTTFGPSTPGALNVVSGIGGPAAVYVGPEGAPNQTYTTDYPNPPDNASSGNNILANGTLINDIDPAYDDCSYTTDGSTATAGFVPTNGSAAPQNIGNLLNDAGVTWGWFEGGFTPTGYTSTGQAICGSSNVNVGGTTETAYSPHHEPFQYFKSTSNPHHLPPSSPSMIGYTDQANHQYDISSFWIAADSGNLPAVSYLKAPRYQDGHPTNSDPLDEQAWLVNTINKLESLPTWSSTAIIINWDDSDGWYDSVMPPIVNPSADPVNDVLNGAGVCGQGTSPLGVQDRCGYGPRIPILVISPYAKSNYVDNTLASQTAIVSFIEYNWKLGNLGPTSYDHLAGSIMNAFNFNQPRTGASGQLFLNPSIGEPVKIHGPAAQNNIGLNSTAMCTDQNTNPDTCAVNSNFNKMSIPSGSYVWFNSNLNLTSKPPSTGLTLYYSGPWIYVTLKNGTTLSLAAPNAQITYSPTATNATTTFTKGQWVTTVPLSFKGNVFLDGLAYQVPKGVSLAGAKVSWTGWFSGTNSSFKVDWQWAAAAYSSFGKLNTSNTTALYNGLGVKPTSGMGAKAGTPQNFEANLIKGGTGNGGKDYTGTFSQTAIAEYQAYLLNE
jgi:phospholipase C